MGNDMEIGLESENDLALGIEKAPTAAMAEQ
jgi:hypothetical protein